MDRQKCSIMFYLSAIRGTQFHSLISPSLALRLSTLEEWNLFHMLVLPSLMEWTDIFGVFGYTIIEYLTSIYKTQISRNDIIDSRRVSLSAGMINYLRPASNLFSLAYVNYNSGRLAWGSRLQRKGEHNETRRASGVHTFECTRTTVKINNKDSQTSDFPDLAIWFLLHIISQSELLLGR